MSETDLQDAILELAGRLGYLRVHFRPALYQSGRWATHYSGDSGFPDTVILGHGRLLVSELKDDKAKATPQQKLWLDAFAEAGAETYLWRPKHWLNGDIERILKKAPPVEESEVAGWPI